jgi:hypothetical protein
MAVTNTFRREPSIKDRLEPRRELTSTRRMIHSTSVLFRQCLLAIGLILCGIVLPIDVANAAVVIQVEDTEIGAGQSGFVNVWISSSDESDSLKLFNVVFGLTPLGSPSSTLEFIAPQTTLGNTDPNYVFVDDLEPTGLMLNWIQNDVVEGGDLTASGGEVELPATLSRRLLARLDVNHLLGAGQSANDAIGETFRISLLEEFMLSNDDTFVTFFDDASGPLSLDFSNVTPGTITIVAPSVTAVPEPSSLILLASGGAGWLVRSRRKRSAQAATPIAR